MSGLVCDCRKPRIQPIRWKSAKWDAPLRNPVCGKPATQFYLAVSGVAICRCGEHGIPVEARTALSVREISRKEAIAAEVMES